MKQSMDTKAKTLTPGEMGVESYSSERFFELSLDMLCIAGMDGYLKRINPAFERTLGYSLEALAQRPFLEFVHPDDQAATLHAMERLGQGDTVVDFENRYRHRDGHWRWISWRSVLSPDDSLIHAVARDITEEKQARQELEESRARLSTIADNLPALVSYVDRDLTFQYGNRTFCDWYGLRPDEIPGTTIAETLGKEVLTTFREDFERVLAGKETVWRKRVEYPTGGRDVEGRWIPDFDDDGQVRGFFTLILDVTQRLQAERSARETTHMLQAVMDTVPHSIFVKNPEGRFQLVNRAFAEFHNMAREEMQGKTSADLFSHTQHQIEAMTALDRQVLEEGIMAEEPRIVFTKADGSREIHHVYKLPLRNDEGAVVGLVGISENITARLEAEEEAAKTNAMLQKVIDSIPYEVFIKDAQERFMWVNKTTARLLGGSPAGLVGQHILETNLGTQEQREAMAAMDREVLQTGKPVESMDHLVTGEDGQLEIHHLIKIPLFDEQGGIWGLVGISQDVTEHRLNEERFRALVEHSPSLIVIKDLEDKYVLVNDRFEEWYGIPGREIIGKTTLDIFPGTAAEEVMAQNREVLERREVVEKRITFPNPDGSQRHLINTKYPLYGNTGEIIGIGTISTDITAYHKMETQFLQSQKLDAVGQLAGGVAHDFNNNLQVIVGFTSLAKDLPGLPGDAREYLEHVMHSVSSASQLTQQLLAFSRQDSFASQDLDLNAVLQNQLKMVRRLIGENIDVTLATQEAPAMVHGDQARLEQVVLNLCLNARDAMPDGGDLHIHTESLLPDVSFLASNPWAENAPYVHLSVSDNGNGMSDLVRHRVFEPFFTTKPVGKGTGLGLASVYGIITQHKGMITAESTLGEGSTFHVYLPMIDARLAKEEKADDGKEIPRGSGTILVAEDEEMLRGMLRKILIMAGYEVVTAQDGEEAIRLWETHKNEVRLVVLDAVMPKANGREVLAAISESGIKVPVLFSTGYSAETIDKSMLEQPHVQLLHKPYTPHVLLERIHAMLTP